MKLIHGIDRITGDQKPSAVSIGNFDGVHLGHQHVIKTLMRRSEQLNATPTVITFEPLAKEFFMPGSVARLSSLDDRAEMLFKLGVETVLCINFDARFAGYSPAGFVEEVLVDALATCYLSVGDDFRFGKDRAGDFSLLQTLGDKFQFEVHAHNTFEYDGERVSSGRVREALQQNNFGLAENLLGRPYSIDGLVSQGQQLGRTLDYPTANIVLQDCVWAVGGVHAVRVIRSDGTQHEAVANIGTRPTVQGTENRLEVHLFDFDDELYGEKLQVQFLNKIRAEKKFESLDELKMQIAKDAGQAQAFFRHSRK
ncbi:MAG: bifunctional riboflavin kinase/FAD synthetase [Arenicella sp.]|nr:bifunctional riboflavin kinase/FAD synthetase [Arenicella sp.]